MAGALMVSQMNSHRDPEYLAARSVMLSVTAVISLNVKFQLTVQELWRLVL